MQWYTRMRAASAAVIQSAYRYHVATLHARPASAASPRGKRASRADGSAAPDENIDWATTVWPETPRRGTNREKALTQLSKMKNRLLKHDKMHTELRMYRLIVKAQGQRNRPPQYDFKLTSIMKRVTQLADVQDSFETDMHVRHQDLMVEMVGLRDDMREIMLRNGHSGSATAHSVGRGVKLKLSGWAASARLAAKKKQQEGAGEVLHASERSVEEQRRWREALHAKHRADATAYVKKTREDQHTRRKREGRKGSRAAPNFAF